jgi:radical SAM superfamily enzyme YgiQ (UPF0313 family)
VIILIIPKSNTEISPLVYPPLGLLYIASMLDEVSIYDMRENNIEDIPDAEFYGFTATTPQIDDVIKSAKYLKENTDSFLFIGGSHASYCPQELQEHFDSVIIGEAEEVICKVLNEKIKGITYSKINKSIDSIPFPARHLLEKSKIVSSELWEGYGYGNGPKATTIITSRGCPWKCSFCSNIPQKVRFRSADNVIEEIKLIISEYDCRNFRFIDDNFIMNEKRLMELSPKLKQLDIKFRCGGRSNLITDNICELLTQAGCEEIGLGIESADNNILKLLNKNETVEDHKKAIKTARNHGLRVKGFFMAGLPGETRKTIENNKKFIEDTEIDKIIATLFTPYPGGAIWNNPKKFGAEIIENNWNKYFQTYPSKSSIKTNLATNEELTANFNEFIKFIRSLQK